MPTKETSPLRTEVTNAGVRLKEETVGASSHLTEVVLFSVHYSFLDNLRIDVSICFLTKISELGWVWWHTPLIS